MFADHPEPKARWRAVSEPLDSVSTARLRMLLPLGNAKQALVESEWPVWNGEREEHEHFVEEILEALGLDVPWRD